MTYNRWVLITCYRYYGNEKEVGIAIKQFMEETNTKRQDIFITTKILTPEGSYQGSYDKCIRSIIALDDVYNYVDLFLIHSPNAGVNAFLEMWTALCMLHFEGKARLIGVSNFGIGQIEMLKECRFEGFWPPYVNQIEVCVQYGAFGADLTISVTSVLPAARDSRILQT